VIDILDSGIVVLIDIETSPLTLSEVMDRVQGYRANPEYAGYDIFLDGDLHAIVARPKQ